MPHNEIQPPLIYLLAFAIGGTVANIYYAQPLAALIGDSLGLSVRSAGLVVTLTQLGYGMGVLCAVPMGDIFENRRLILSMTALTIVGLMGLTFVTTKELYFLMAFVTGLGASSVQVMVPYAAHFARAENRGHVVGQLMSGLMTGIMLSRPIASLLTDAFNWHAVFVFSLVLMGFLFILLWQYLPVRAPEHQELRYVHLLKSMVHIFAHTPILRRRAIYQGLLFGSFCLFWTAVPIFLGGPEFHFSQSAIAVFALVGFTGAISAPFAGKAADRGWTKWATGVAMTSCMMAFVTGQLFHPGSKLALISLVVSAILLDAGITANLILGQREIFSLAAQLRSRLNGLYVATIFVGGSAGSALGAWAIAQGGWKMASWVGCGLPAAAFLFYLTEFLGFL